MVTSTIWRLDVPFEHRALASSLGARWDAALKSFTYTGPAVPPALTVYRPREYSWSAFQESTGTGNRKPTTDTGEITLRTDQVSDVRTLWAAFAAGAPEVLVANGTGTGKTYTSIALSKSLPNSGKILVMCPKSAMASWRLSIQRMGDSGKRFCIINYDVAKKLLKPPRTPASAKKPAKTAAGERNRKRREAWRHAEQGTPVVSWDVIITDESQLASNFDAQRTAAVESLLASGVRVIRVSATPGRDVSRLGYMERVFSWRCGLPIPSAASKETWAAFCQANGMQVKYTKLRAKDGRSPGRLEWTPNKRDGQLINKLMFGGDRPWAVHSVPAHWPEQDRRLMPIELDAVERGLYEEAWNEFVAVSKNLDAEKARRKKSGVATAPPGAQAKGLAAMMRYRQKVGQIKAPYVAQIVKDHLELGFQVAISVEFRATADALLERLPPGKVAIFAGWNSNVREEERLAFQRGEKSIIIFTPAEAFNLHQGEHGGNDVPRVQVVGEPSWSAITGLQKEGRTQRDGRAAPVIYPYALETIDNKIISGLVAGIQGIQGMLGDDTTAISRLSASLGVTLYS